MRGDPRHFDGPPAAAPADVNAAETAAPPVLLLGVATNIHSHQFGTDILNLSHFIFFPFVPAHLQGLFCVLRLDARALIAPTGRKLRLHWAATATGDKGWVDADINVAFAMSVGDAGTAKFESRPVEEGDASSYAGPPGVIVPVPLKGITATDRTDLRFVAEWEEKRYDLGSIAIGTYAPPPLSNDERKAIASRPGAAKSVYARISCPVCDSSLVAYTNLQDDAKSTKLPPDAVDVATLGDRWLCKCGKANIDLTSLKGGLPHLLRTPVGHDTSVTNLAPLYQRGHVASLFREYSAVIESNPAEEEVQTFIDSHPLLWAFLSPTRILSKPRILTHHAADFGILTHQRILYLVELEKPQTKLLTAKGHPHSQAAAAINQTLDWASVVANKRAALLDELNIKPDEVCDIRYIVVAGMSKDAPIKGLEKIHAALPAKTQFYCFDQLGAFLLAVEANLVSL
jgi:hypothetical protein